MTIPTWYGSDGNICIIMTSSIIMHLTSVAIARRTYESTILSRRMAISCMVQKSIVTRIIVTFMIDVTMPKFSTLSMVSVVPNTMVSRVELMEVTGVII